MRATTVACFGYDDWTWRNPPRESTVAADRVRIVTDPGSGARLGRAGAGHRDTGHALLRPAPLCFTVRAVVTGALSEHRDHAGLLLRIDDTHRIVAGLASVDGVAQLGALVVRDTWDRSSVPLAGLREHGGPLTLALRRTEEQVEVRYGLAGKEPRTLLQVTHLPVGGEAYVGVACASPVGPGFTAHFGQLRFLSG